MLLKYMSNKFNRQNMILPEDQMKQILTNSDIDTYINLCNSSHIMRTMCTNSLWQDKFKQRGWVVPDIVKYHMTYDYWMHLYDFHTQADDYRQSYE